MQILLYQSFPLSMEYKVSYNLKLFLWNITKTRIVNVVDSKKPEIMLVGDANLNMCPDAKFEEPGYIAVDEYDGNLTKKVKVTEKQDKIIYQVSDKSKNKFVQNKYPYTLHPTKMICRKNSYIITFFDSK